MDVEVQIFFNYIRSGFCDRGHFPFIGRLQTTSRRVLAKGYKTVQTALLRAMRYLNIILTWFFNGVSSVPPY